VHSHNSNCIYSVAKSNGDSIEFSLSIAEQRAVGFIPAWSLAFLYYNSEATVSLLCLLPVPMLFQFILIYLNLF